MRRENDVGYTGAMRDTAEELDTIQDAMRRRQASTQEKHGGLWEGLTMLRVNCRCRMAERL